MSKFILFIIHVFILTVPVMSGAQMLPLSYESEVLQERIMSNSIVDILPAGSRIWFGTNKGVMMTEDNGQTFRTFGRSDGLGKGSVSALAVGGGRVWVATAFDSVLDEGTLTVGGGLAYTENNGETWHYINQPVDPRDVQDYKPTTTTVQNVTYDIAIAGDTLWIASWGGGVRRSTDIGATWQVVPPDNQPFDALQYLNHRGFSVIAAHNGIWVGTSGGVNKSTDGGFSWTNYTASNGSGISGDFVTALAEQRYDGNSIIWAATWKAEGAEEEYGVSITENNGLTWRIIMTNVRAHNFGFDGRDAYIATDTGVWKTDDFGESWAVIPPVKNLRNKILGFVFNGVNVLNGGLWLASNDGLARTNDNGNSWDIFRAYESTKDADVPETYAYPNPFSPSRHNVLAGDGNVRIQYHTTMATKVTLSVYDFALKEVARVVKGEARPADAELSETWNGRNDYGDIVANGVYFYKLDLEGQGTHWGKIVVID